MNKLITALLFTIMPLPVLAAPLDVATNTWYAKTVSLFVGARYFPDNQPFRPTAPATRGEFVELVDKLLGGVTHAPFHGQSFDDVSANSATFPYFEEAGLQGWVKGTNSCYGTHPCSANPDSPINRAEAAALMIRAFGLQAKSQSPSFQDNPVGQWFTDNIRTAASLCILQGDMGGSKVRPSDNMNRAEMVVMLKRLKEGLGYPKCIDNQDVTLPQAPVFHIETNVTSTSSSLPSGLMTPRGNGVQTYSQCTASAWRCSPGGCTVGGAVIAPSCALLDLTCLNPDAAKPAQVTQSCSPVPSINPDQKILDRMKANIDTWDKLHQDIIAKEKQLSLQANSVAGSACLRTVADIEASFVLRYNEYIDIYNHNRSSLNEEQVSLQQIEDAMLTIQDQFKQAPSICY